MDGAIQITVRFYKYKEQEFICKVREVNLVDMIKIKSNIDETSTVSINFNPKQEQYVPMISEWIAETGSIIDKFTLA